MKILLRAEDTAGRAAVLQDTVPPAWGGPPLHYHGWDELFYVLAGELMFRVGEDILVRSAGETAFAPGDVHHTFANFSDEAATYLVVCTPAGFERYFDPEPRGELPPRHAVGPSLRNPNSTP